MNSDNSKMDSDLLLLSAAIKIYLSLYKNQYYSKDKCDGSESTDAMSASNSPVQLDYVCHLCNVPGHLIKDCKNTRPKLEWFTPYQGEKRSCGEFECRRCKRSWISSNSYANMSQQCLKCKMPVFPHKQKVLGERINTNKN